MGMAIIRGAPGSAWVNDTDKIWWQAFCEFQRSCARCIALHHAIGPYFPFPLHDLCNCVQRPVKPGGTAEAFIDYQEAVAELTPAGQAAAMGASNWRLVQSGLAKWEDVVTPGRIRDFREVADSLGLSVDRMVKAGVRPHLARQAFDATHTTGHSAAGSERAAIIKGLKNHGLTDQRIIAEVGDLLAGRMGIEPLGGQQPQPPPPPAPPTKPKPAPPQPPSPPPVPKPNPPPAPAPAPAPAPLAPSRAKAGPIADPRPSIQEAAAIGAQYGVEVKIGGYDVQVRRYGNTPEKAKWAIAIYDHTEDTIYLNELADYWDDPQATMRNANARGWLSSDSAMHVIHHEIGHALHARAIGMANFGPTRRAPLGPGEAQMIVERVSEYAKTNPLEVVAEIYAGMKAGVVYDAEVMRLYDRFGGPTP